MAEANDSCEELYIHVALLDTSKASDVVSHTLMLNALHQQGITGEMWQLYDCMYTNIQSTVKWKDNLPDSFTEGQGNRQSGNAPANNYKFGKNKILNHLDEWPSNWTGSINTGAVMVADDTAVPAKNQIDLQSVKKLLYWMLPENAINSTYRIQR